ncbi:MAG TPA: hypothetical protein DCR40_05870 [Prolixibacteraceae bacterium]|nr:hypothetical protein [Prolixibacteraceae bacterium]
MQQTYNHLLTFLFKHRYFRNELFKSIEISFAEGTTKLLNDLCIIIKPFTGGFHLLACNTELLDSLNDTDPIQLHFNCTDPLYINYTELPLYHLTDNLLYFNNLSVIPDQDGEGFRPNEAEFVGQSEVVPVSHGKIKLPTFESSKKYRFTDALGNEISSQSITQTKQYSNEFMLSDLPQGLVRFFADDVESGKVYYHPKSFWKKPLGIVDIYVGELFNQYKEKGKVDYAVSFNNRKTIWKYFFVSPVYQKFSNLSIINKGSEQIFNPPQKQLVYKNPEAWVFESKNKIPLSEISDEIYQLFDNYESEQRPGKIIHKNLVKATPEQLHYEVTKSEEPAYSHIYL